MSNNIAVEGRLGNDAEKRFTPSGKAFVKFSLADNVFSHGEKRTQWYSCTLFGARAEALEPHLTKGAQVVVFGEFATNQGKDGKTYLNINVHNVALVGGRQQGGEQVTTSQSSDDFAFDGDEIPF